MTRDQDVHVQLSLDQCQRFRFAPGYDLVTMGQSDAELSDRHDLLFGVVQVLKKMKCYNFGKKNYIFKALNLVKVSPHDVDIAGQCLEVVVRLFGAQVPGAEDVLNPPRNKQFLELAG